MVLSIPVLDRKLRSHSVTSATKTFAKSKGVQSGAREPGIRGKPMALFVRRAQTRSKRSRFITLVHAATKSFTNFS